MCTDSTYLKNRDDCLKKTCSGNAQLQDAQTTWSYFCAYVNGGGLGLPTGGLGGGGSISLPTSLFNTGTPKPSPTNSSSSGNSNNSGGNGNSNGNLGSSNNGGDDNKSSVPIGAIIGGVVGGIALILMLIFLIFYFRRNRNRQPVQGVSYPQSPPVNTFPPYQSPPQPPMAHMNMGPSPVIHPSMGGGASPNPSFNSATPFMNQGQNYTPSGNSFVSGQPSFNNGPQPVTAYHTPPSHLPPGAGMGAPMSSQGNIYPENTGSTNVGSPFLSPTSAYSQSFGTHQSVPPTSPSSASIPTSASSQHHLLGATSYTNLHANSSPSPPSTGSSPSQQAAAQLSEKQRLQIHLEYQDGAATAASSSSAAGYPAPASSGFHVTNAHQQDGLDGRSAIYTTTSTSGVSSKGGGYTVTNPTTDGSDAPPTYSERS
ncbi:hypothetical protein CVT24_011290 [Panaeolus cyanescens]|uniref:Extracellular membrane protein CFEM domain-containing protein n=1 Tax=Panaeolus cyanescens TaxID=181874 RepID=A0A409YUX0_9AGAR|nr:hypothetical protein CVT24_011290 [Panaeolus cyanescens]